MLSRECCHRLLFVETLAGMKSVGQAEFEAAQGEVAAGRMRRS